MIVRRQRGKCAMKTVRFLLAVLLGALCAGGAFAQDKPAAKPVKAVRFGKLWDAKGKLWTNAIVIVEGDRIRTVTTDASAIPAGAETIDLSKYTGLPGLIDVHTHMTIYTDETPGEPMLKRSEEHTSELQSPCNLVCRLLLEKKKKKTT